MMSTYEQGPETERLLHRAFRTADALAFYELNSHPEVMRYTGEPAIGSVEEAESAIANYPDFKQVGYGRWACISKATGKIIGFCGLKYLPELGEVDVGYRFFPEYWGQGLATEACQASLRFGFEQIGLTEIIGLVKPENLASIRVLEKSGMKQKGEVDYDGEQALKFVRSRKELID